MTSERQFEVLLRSWFDEAAPSDQPHGLLESVVTATAHARPRPAWLVRLGGEPMPQPSRQGLNRFAPLALVATAVVVALLIGIGLIVRSPDVGPSPIPGPTHNATQEPNATPEPTQRGAAAWTATGSMIPDRAGYTATLLSDGTVLVTGGGDQGPTVTGGPEELFPSASAELYHPSSGTWTATGSMIEGRESHTATLLPDGRVLVAGGMSYDPDTGTWNGSSAELYDPISGTWTATGGMIEDRWAHTATRLLDGKVLVAGGWGDIGQERVLAPLASAELYDPDSGTWTATGSMTGSNWRTATLLLDGRVLLTGGGDGGPSGSAELYDPDAGTWTVTGNMIEGRVGHTVTLLPDGTVLVTGGSGSTSTGGMASAELYHPISGTWTVTGNMIEGRDGHTATLLPDGKVLVVGGNSNRHSDIGVLTSAELYDPSSGSWTATVTMVEGRNLHAATLLSDGTLLVVGGYGDRSALLTSAELYDPGGGN